MAMFSLTMVSGAAGRTSGLDQGALFGTGEAEKTVGIKSLKKYEGVPERSDF